MVACLYHMQSTAVSHYLRLHAFFCSIFRCSTSDTVKVPAMGNCLDCIHVVSNLDRCSTFVCCFCISPLQSWVEHGPAWDVLVQTQDCSSQLWKQLGLQPRPGHLKAAPAHRGFMLGLDATFICGLDWFMREILAVHDAHRLWVCQAKCAACESYWLHLTLLWVKCKRTQNNPRPVTTGGRRLKWFEQKGFDACMVTHFDSIDKLVQNTCLGSEFTLQQQQREASIKSRPCDHSAFSKHQAVFCLDTALKLLIEHSTLKPLLHVDVRVPACISMTTATHQFKVQCSQKQRWMKYWQTPIDTAHQLHPFCGVLPKNQIIQAHNSQAWIR